MEKQSEKSTVDGFNGIEGFNGIQRDFGVKDREDGWVKGWGSIEKDMIDEKLFILAPEIIASLPGGEAVSGQADFIEGARDIGPGGEAVSGQADFIEKDNGFIEKDLGCREEQWIGGGSSNIDKGVGDV